MKVDLAILKIENACTGCGACTNVCPKGCLSLRPNEEGFYYPIYDSSECINCRLCEKACHILNQSEHPFPTKDSFFMYRSNDAELLRTSSSGGAFTLFSEWVLDKGGVVFGSRYNADNNRLEVFNTETTSLASLRKSKYLESFTGKTFLDIRHYLNSGRRVLYCGTPCQVRGLKRYLELTKTKTDLLLTIDFACHGVPSNNFFNQFKELFENKRRKVVDVDFRHKDFTKHNMQWHNMTLRLVFSDGTTEVYPRFSYYYYYYEPFLDNLFLRKSCYNCDIAQHSDADVTLGDFWGIYKHRTELDDNKGMSFVCINNKKIMPLWKELSKAGFAEQLPYDAIEYQYVDKRERRLKQFEIRNQFVRNILKYGYKHAIERHYGAVNIKKTIIIYRIKNIVKRIVGYKQS